MSTHCDSSQFKPGPTNACGPETPKDSNTHQLDPETMVVKSKLERRLRSQSHAKSGESPAATQHVIVHDEEGLKLVPVEELPQERRLKDDSQQENFDHVSKNYMRVILY